MMAGDTPTGDTAGDPTSPRVPASSSALPIRRYAADIVEAVRSNPVVVVLGETGSGKTTQISQILLDAGLAQEGAVAVTQPRRVVRGNGQHTLCVHVCGEGMEWKAEGLCRGDQSLHDQHIRAPRHSTQAAVTVARRVAQERNGEVGREVGYAVRFEECACRATKIKYLTGASMFGSAEGWKFKERVRDPCAVCG